MVYAEFPDVCVLPGRNRETGVGQLNHVGLTLPLLTN